MFNEIDPLGYVVSSDDDDYPFARLLADDVSDDSDDALLAQFISKSDIYDNLTLICVDFGHVHYSSTSWNICAIVH